MLQFIGQGVKACQALMEEAKVSTQTDEHGPLSDVTPTFLLQQLIFLTVTTHTSWKYSGRFCQYTRPAFSFGLHFYPQLALLRENLIRPVDVNHLGIIEAIE